MTTWLEQYRRMNKPRETEGIADTYLIRPLGGLIAFALRPLSIKPTAVSLAALAAGLWSAWHYWRVSATGAPTWDAVWGAVALLVHSALDGADGQLARLTNQHTPLGRLIDGVCDHFVFAAIYLAFWFGYLQRGGQWPWLVLGLAFLAGASHSLQSSAVEYERLLYADWVAGRNRIEETHPEQVQQDVARVTGPLAGVATRWLQTNFLQQRKLLRSSARLERMVLQLRQSDPDRLHQLRQIYRRHQRPMLHKWWLMAPNSHKLAIVLAAFVPAPGTTFWGGLGTCWFYFFDLALIPVLAWLVWLQRRADARVFQQLGLESSQFELGERPGLVNTLPADR